MIVRIILAGLMVWPVVTLAQSADSDGARLVAEFVNEMATLQGRFEQSMLDADGEVVERTSGTLQIQRPGQFRWSYATPYEQVLVADGLNIWSYDVDLAQVTVKPQQEALADTPAMLLSGAQDALQQFNNDGSFVEAGTTWVQLSPRNTESGFLRVDLGFKNDILSRMVFHDNLKQTTLVALYDVVVNAPIAADLFRFTVPDDVDVVGIPAAAVATTP
ncbi:MAG: outer membrane lipoprotein chaperone LolA [Gammaproteobacteria bacterium]|nr:outer membrane lipoprotein chaperone LolA [Gammaproteobacteria bacterium]MDH5303940.1 outer membrane lipoprotein chaperone LolA [Gammaproteobacteria bacterium]MDH5321097.1 outer membrane lipoprotein chaperone LolA [Gammaproteobacteria bacterium]